MVTVLMEARREGEGERERERERERRAPTYECI